jgi:hypothetical protein
MEWLGNVVIMGGERAAKELPECKPAGGEGGGRKGRPRLRWMDGVELDWRYMGVKRWRTRVLDRIEWASVAREGKTKLKEL